MELQLHLNFLFPGLLCDLLWSDPDKDVQGWGENDRGVSFTFGADVVSKFLNRHDLDLICRAHQVNFEDFFFDQGGHGQRTAQTQFGLNSTLAPITLWPEAHLGPRITSTRCLLWT